MRRPSPRSERLFLLAIIALLFACGRARPSLGYTEAGPNHVLTFEQDTTDAPWSPWRRNTDAHGGTGALYLRPGDEYIPLVRTTFGATGEMPQRVRVSFWVRTEGRVGKLRTFVHNTDRMGSRRFYSRIIRPGEIPGGTWCEVHTEIALDTLQAAGDDRFDVVLWNEGGTTMTVDDARITFVTSAILGSDAGTPFDVDSLTDGRMPDGRAPDPRYASPLNDTLR